MSLPLFLFVVTGLAFGSFGNVLLYRIHSQKPITGRSVCLSCGRTLSWYELIPIISFIVLRRRCHHCHHPISLQYPLVEAVSSALFLFALLLHPIDPVFALITAFVLYFLFLACVFDGRYQQIPDTFTLLIGLLAILSVVLHGDYLSSLLGGIIMLMWFGGQWILSRGTAVGTGDIFLTIVLGVWLGLRYALMTLVFSYMAGAIILVTMILLHRIRTKQQRIAFVPFLMIGVLLTLFGTGDAYLRLIGF